MASAYGQDAGPAPGDEAGGVEGGEEGGVGEEAPAVAVDGAAPAVPVDGLVAPAVPVDGVVAAAAEDAAADAFLIAALGEGEAPVPEEELAVFLTEVMEIAAG